MSSKMHSGIHSGHLALLLNIGSSTITASIILLERNGNNSVLYEYLSVPPTQSFNGNRVSASRMEDNIFQTLESVLEMIIKEGFSEIEKKGYSHKKILSTHIVLASPWYISQTRIFHVKREQKMFVSDRVLKSMIEQEKETFIRSVNSSNFGTNPSQYRYEMMEDRLMQVRLNGYKASRPSNKTASSFELDLYLSAIDKDFSAKMKNLIFRSIHTPSLLFHSLPFAIFHPLKRVLSDTDYTLLLLGDEVSEIAVIKKDLLIETITLPIGKNYFHKQISQKLNTSGATALSLFRMYNQKKIEKTVSIKIEETLKDAFMYWNTLLQKAFKGSSGEYFLPKRIYLVAPDDFKQLFDRFAFTDSSDLVLINNTAKDFDFTALPHFQRTAIQMFFLSEIAH